MEHQNLPNKFDLASYLDVKRKLIDDALKTYFDSRGSEQNMVFEAMRYSLLAGGKRLRPILCIAAAESVGGNGLDIMPAACGLEMIHTYSLIHDDLPAMDNDRLRRGKPTCHIAYDESTAILAGDALLTYAFEILLSNEMINDKNAIKWVNAASYIAQAIGYNGMIFGQTIDVQSEGLSLKYKQLERMHFLKTGKLIHASIYSGALLSNANPDQIHKLGIYANNIGLAFQIMDDILDIEGDAEIMGKAKNADIQRHKNTYPSILGLKKSKIYARKLINDALQVIRNFDNKSDPMRAIADYIINRKR